MIPVFAPLKNQIDFSEHKIVEELLGNDIITLSYKYKYQDTNLLETTIYTNKQQEIGITDWYLTKSFAILVRFFTSSVP